MQTFTKATSYRVPAAIALRGAGSLPGQATEGSFGNRRTFSRGEEIFAEGDACNVFYKVVSGTVRTVTLLSDGRRQIDAFHLPGDVFGLEGGPNHRFSAEAVDRVVAIAYRRGVAQSDPKFGEQIMTSMLSSLDRAHDHMMLLGRKTALEKIASFLLDLACRMARADRVDLPMTRSDIADHLGLTIETVSRTLTQMVRDGLIRLGETGRSIILADKVALHQLAT